MREPSCEDKNKWKQDENDKKIEPVIRQFRRQQQFYGSTLATSSFRAFYNGTPRRAKSAEKLSTFEKNRSVGGGGGRGEQKQQLQQWNWGRCADRDTKVQNKLVNIDILQHWKDNICTTRGQLQFGEHRKRQKRASGFSCAIRFFHTVICKITN